MKKIFAALLSLFALIGFSAAFPFGNGYTGTGFFVGEPLSSSSVDISYTFIARSSSTIDTAGVLTRKFGSDPLTYRLTLQTDSGGLPNGAVATGTFTSTLSGRVWKFVSLNQSVSLVSGQRYHLVLTYLSGAVSGSNYVTSASLGGSGQPDSRWPVDLTFGGLDRLYFNGAFWSDDNQAPSFMLFNSFNPAIAQGAPYSSVTSAKIYGALWASQVFVLNHTEQVNSVSAFVRKNAPSNPTDSLFFQLRWANNTPITPFQLLVANNVVTQNYNWQTAPVSIPPILPSGTYMLVLESLASDASSTFRWSALSTVNFSFIPTEALTYNGTQSLLQYSYDGGNSWTSRPELDYAFSLDLTTPPDLTAPSVQLLSPANGSIFTSGSNIQFSCSASDPDDSVLANVTLWSNFSGVWAPNATALSPANGSTSTFTVSLPNGYYAWNCMAFDAAGNNAFAPTNYTLRVYSTPPSSSILTPPNNTVINGLVNLTANATSPVGVANVSYQWWNGFSWNTLGTAFSAPWSFIWNTNFWPQGVVTVRSFATDVLGLQELSPVGFAFFVDHMPPSVTKLEVLYPGVQDFVRPTQTVTLQLNVSDNRGVANVTLDTSQLGGPSALNTTVVAGSFAGPWAIVQGNVTVGSIDEGIYSVPIYAWDQALPAANLNASSNFSVEVQAP